MAEGSDELTVESDGFTKHVQRGILLTVGQTATVNVTLKMTAFVGAHRLVQGNSLNVPCPQGTSKPQNPATAQG